MDYLKQEYGVTVQQIMAVCEVSERTARRWLSGETKTPAPMARLLWLELSGKIMPTSWPHHWRFNQLGCLEGETHAPALAWQQLTWYGYAIQGWHDALRLLPEIQAFIDQVRDKLPVAEVVQLEAYQQRINELRRQSRQSPGQAVAQARGETIPTETIADLEAPTRHRASGC